MLGPTRDDEQLAGLQVHRSVTKLDVEGAFDHQEQLIRFIVLVPDEFALDLHQANLILIVARDDPRRPMIGEARQLLGKVHLVGHQ